MTGEFFEALLDEIDINQEDIDLLSPLVLAYVGDSVYEVFVRTFLVSQGNAPVHKLHVRSTDYVKAKAQSDIIHRIMEFLTPDELDVVRRGRNAKSGTIPKNADLAEYKYATGFESLIGSLFLKRQFHRLLEILKLAVNENTCQE